jgi:hypothetical protein
LLTHCESNEQKYKLLSLDINQLQRENEKSIAYIKFLIEKAKNNHLNHSSGESETYNDNDDLCAVPSEFLDVSHLCDPDDWNYNDTPEMLAAERAGVIRDDLEEFNLNSRNNINNSKGNLT